MPSFICWADNAPYKARAGGWKKWPCGGNLPLENHNFRRENIEQFQQTACPQVQPCYYVAGDCDFVLIFLVRDMAPCRPTGLRRCRCQP
jgi:DNA-binding Lrp family transcriptional regulator